MPDSIQSCLQTVSFCCEVHTYKLRNHICNVHFSLLPLLTNKESFLALLQQNKEQMMLIRFVIDTLSVHFMLLLRMMANVVCSPGAS